MKLKEKFDSIDQSKLNADQKDFLSKIEKATKNFTSDNKEVNDKVEGALDKMIATFKEKMPEAIKTKAEKKEPKTSAKKSSQTSSPKRTVMSVAKEIRKDGESWADAQKRARAEMKKDKDSATKEVKTEMDKLLAFIKTRKELEGIHGTDLKRDSSREAKPRGRRISKDGNVYYENRENRIDRLAPNYPKDAPMLAGGGDVGKKLYYERMNVGKAKYTVNYHDGVKTHRDGSAFYDLAIFKNKKDLQDFISKLSKEGYKEKTYFYAKGGMLSPRERYNLEIKGMTGVSVGAIEKYIDENNLNDNDVLNIVVGLGRKQLKGADVSTAMVGKKGNAESKKLIEFVKDNKAMKLELGGNLKPEEKLELRILKSIQGFNQGNSLGGIMEVLGYSNLRFNKNATEKENKEVADSLKSLVKKGYVEGDVDGKISYSENFKITKKGSEYLRKFSYGSYELGGTIVTDLAGHTGGSLGGDPTLLSGVSGTSYSGLVGETGAMSSGEMFENGGSVGGYDLAGNLGGNFNVGQNDGALSGVTGTQYSGLVGETGAMSSGELFENGGGIQQSFVVVDSFGNPAQHLNNGGYLTDPTFGQFQAGVYAEGGSLENHGIKEGDTFIKTIAGGIQKVKDKDGKIVFINLATGERDSQPPLPFADGGMTEGVFLVKKGDRVIADFNSEKEAMKFIYEYGLRYPRTNLELVDSNYVPKTQSVYLPKKRLTEKEWMSKHSESNEARAYAGGGKVEHYDLDKEKLNKDAQWYADRIISGNSSTSKESLLNDIEEYNKDLYLLEIGRIKPAKVIGTGYKGNTRKMANTWLLERIYVNKKILELLNGKIFADGGELNAFSMRMVKGTNSKPDEVLTENQEVKFAKGGSLREKRNDYLSKLGDKEADVWDKVGANSGTKIRGDKKMLKAYAEGVEEMLIEENVQGRSFDQEDYDFYTDQNWHLFNDFLVWNGYYKPAMTIVEKKWREKAFKEGNIYVSDPEVITVKGVSPSKSKSKNYIVHADIESITIKKDGKEIKVKGSDVLNGANVLKKGGELSESATYYPKRSIVSVKLKNGKNINPANGYWVLKTPKISRTQFEEESFEYKKGGKVSFAEKSKAIAKNFEGKRVEPEYQKEYGKTYDAKEAKEVGDKIAGAQKAKYDAKAEKGAVVKRKSNNPKAGSAMVLAKEIRKDGEKWNDALKRAYEMMKNK